MNTMPEELAAYLAERARLLQLAIDGRDLTTAFDLINQMKEEVDRVVENEGDTALALAELMADFEDEGVTPFVPNW